MANIDFSLFSDASSDNTSSTPSNGEVISNYGSKGNGLSLGHSNLSLSSGMGNVAVSMLPVLDTAIKSVTSIINTAIICSAEVRKVSIQEREWTKRVEAECERDIALAREQTRQVAIQEREKTKRFYMEVALRCQEMEQHLNELKLYYQNEERTVALEHLKFKAVLGELSEHRNFLSRSTEQFLEELAHCTDKEERISIRENVISMSKELLALAKIIVVLQESGG